VGVSGGGGHRGGGVKGKAGAAFGRRRGPSSPKHHGEKGKRIKGVSFPMQERRGPFHRREGGGAPHWGDWKRRIQAEKEEGHASRSRGGKVFRNQEKEDAIKRIRHKGKKTKPRSP